MSLTLPATSQASVEDHWVELPVTSTLSLKVLVHQPGFEDQLKMNPYLDLADTLWERLQTCVKDWDVVDAEGNKLPFNRENVNRLCAVYPQAFVRLMSVVTDEFYRSDADVLKNWQLPPLAGGTTTNDATTDSTSLSHSGTD